MTDLDELAEAGEQVTSTDLKAISALALKQLELQADVAKAKAVLTKAEESLRKVQNNDLPAALKAAGMPSFTLDNGMKVSYEEDMKINLPKVRKSAIVEKMKEWGYDGSVSNTITIDLGKGNNNTSAAIMEQAKELGVDATLAEDIPAGTVKKALKARSKEGKNDDLAFFGAFSFTRATVK